MCVETPPGWKMKEIKPQVCYKEMDGNIFVIALKYARISAFWPQLQSIRWITYEEILRWNFMVYGTRALEYSTISLFSGRRFTLDKTLLSASPVSSIEWRNRSNSRHRCHSFPSTALVNNLIASVLFSSSCSRLCKTSRYEPAVFSLLNDKQVWEMGQDIQKE